MTVMMVSDRGVPLMCETEGCGQRATGVWSTTWAGGQSGYPHRACDQHNPMASTAGALPWRFTSHSLCHACGQPVRIWPQQVVYPGTAG